MSAAREGQADVTIDEAQEKFYHEVIELLLAAGYFRARISMLTRFDKVVGGLAWCIVSSGVDIQMDLLFQEDAQIGQQIELGESIEEALVRMKCPHPLRSYQIRGLDTEKIFPVIQWLVKKVIEVRTETGDLLRQFSQAQFSKRFSTPVELKARHSFQQSRQFENSVHDAFRPRRKFRNARGASETDEESRVQCTLLEYGNRSHVSKHLDESEVADGRGRKSVLGDTLEDRRRQQEETAKKEQEKVETIMKSFATVSGSSSSVSTSHLGNLVGANAEMIQEIAAMYAQKAEELGLNEAQMAQFFSAEVHKRNVDSKTKQKEKLEAHLVEIRSSHSALEQSMLEIQSAYHKKLALNRRIEEETAKLEALETPENTVVVQKLRHLVTTNEMMKRQQEAFRQHCSSERKQWMSRLETLGVDANSPAELERKRRIAETHAEDRAKLEQMRQLLGKKNREIASIERKIDDKPSRSELQTYQRQFMECFDQMQAKFVETKLYYNSYNISSDIKSFTEKEVSILQSIEKNYPEAMKTPNNRIKLKESMKQIIDGVRTNAEKVSNKLNAERVTLEDLNNRYSELQKKERAYFALTKQFADACALNEKLTSGET